MYTIVLSKIRSFKSVFLNIEILSKSSSDSLYEGGKSKYFKEFLGCALFKPNSFEILSKLICYKLLV